MPTIPSDLTASLELELSFESPHVVTYWVWFRSGDSGWQQLASGTDEDAVTSTRHVTSSDRWASRARSATGRSWRVTPGRRTAPGSTSGRMMTRSTTRRSRA